MEKIEWQKIKKVVFTHKIGTSDTLEDFYFTKRKGQKFRVRAGVILLNNGALGSFSVKDFLIFFGFRKVGIIGTGTQSNQRRVQCPRCKFVQRLVEEYQRCENCKKKFYLYDDKW